VGRAKTKGVRGRQRGSVAGSTGRRVGRRDKDKLAIHGGTPVRTKPFPQRRPFDQREIKAATAAIRSQNLFWSGGKYVVAFEKKFPGYYGQKYGVAATSGTAAIHLAVGAINPNPGDEIITAPITDLGSVVPILLQNAIPVFADADPATMNMTPETVEAKITQRTRAIIAVHLFGNACEIDAIRRIARRHRIPLIEDCSQAHATRYKGKYLGTFGDIAAFSMQQSKHMTTGDGGIAISNNARYGKRMKAFQDKGWPYLRFGRRAYRFLAPNYRFNELQAAVALEQLKKVRSVARRRQRLGTLLSKLIAGAPGVLPPAVTPGSEHTYWLYPLRIVGGPAKRFCKVLAAEGVGAWANYIGVPIFLCAETLTHKNTYGDSHCPFTCPSAGREYEYVDGMCPGAEEGLKHVAPIALHEHYTERDIRDTARAICKVAQALYGG